MFKYREFLAKEFTIVTRSDKELFLKYDYFLTAARKFEEFSKAQSLNIQVLKDPDYIFSLDERTVEIMTYWLVNQLNALQATFPSFDEYKRTNLWVVNWASEFSDIEPV